MAREGLPSAFPLRRPTCPKARQGPGIGEVHDRWGWKTQAGGTPPLSLCRWVGQVGLNLGLVYSIEQVLGVHGQSVRGCQHLPLALLTQGGHGILLGQSHLIDELRQVLVEQFLGPFNL